MLKRNCFSLYLVFFFSQVLLQGQEKDSLKTYTLDKVIITANKFETNIRETSTRVELINFDKVSNTNGNRLPEILKTSSSVFIKSYGLTPSLQTVSLNGLGAEHTLILIDGIKISSIQNGQVDLSLIPKDNIHHIEIINNGGSSIYGSEAIGGIINIITKNNSTSTAIKNFNLASSISAGSFNTYKYSLSITQAIKNFSGNIFFNKENSCGNFNYLFDNGLTIEKKERKNSAYKIYDLGINTTGFFDSLNIIKIYSTYSHQDKEVPGIETGTPSPNTKQKDRNWNNIISYTNKISTSKEFNASFNFQNNLMNYSVESKQNSFYKNITYFVSPELKWLSENHNIVTGYSFRYSSLNSNEVEESAIRNEHAIFISSGILLFEGIKIFPSARVDYLSDIKKSVLTYNLGFNFQPIGGIDFNIKVNAGKNFRAPTFNDLFWKQSGNKNLKPENSFNIETGFIFITNSPLNFQFEFTYLNISAKDKIVWTPQRNLLWKPMNIASSISNNYLATLAIKKSFTDKMLIKFESGVNFVNSKKTSAAFKDDPTKDKYIPFLPLQSIKLSFSLEYDFAGVNFYFNHNGKRFGDFENINTLKCFNTLDGNVFFKFNTAGISSQIKFEINNITNTNYETVSGYPMPLRNFLFTILINI